MAYITASDFDDVYCTYSLAEAYAKTQRMEYYADEVIDHVVSIFKTEHDKFMESLHSSAKRLGGTGVNCVEIPIKTFTIQKVHSKTSPIEWKMNREEMYKHIDDQTGVYYEHPSEFEIVSMMDVIERTDVLRRIEAVISSDPRVYLHFYKTSTCPSNGVTEFNCTLLLGMRMRGDVPEKAINIRKEYVAKLDALRASY